MDKLASGNLSKKPHINMVKKEVEYKSLLSHRYQSKDKPSRKKQSLKKVITKTFKDTKKVEKTQFKSTAKFGQNTDESLTE